MIADEAAAFSTSSFDGFTPDEWAMFSMVPRKLLASGSFFAMIEADNRMTFNVPKTLFYSREKKNVLYCLCSHITRKVLICIAP